MRKYLFPTILAIFLYFVASFFANEILVNYDFSYLERLKYSSIAGGLFAVIGLFWGVYNYNKSIKNKEKSKADCYERISEVQRDALACVLHATSVYLRGSDDVGISEISKNLVIAKTDLQSGKVKDMNHIKLYFAPTGEIQNHAIEHNWSDEYIELSGLFERYTANY